jgi:hypothetical protein
MGTAISSPLVGEVAELRPEALAEREGGDGKAAPRNSWRGARQNTPP